MGVGRTGAWGAGGGVLASHTYHTVQPGSLSQPWLASGVSQCHPTEWGHAHRGHGTCTGWLTNDWLCTTHQLAPYNSISHAVHITACLPRSSLPCQLRACTYNMTTGVRYHRSARPPVWVLVSKGNAGARLQQAYGVHRPAEPAHENSDRNRANASV